jgi:4-amino-4-deoxy-L-arabinose transferase-like glycosyltransferase
MIKIKWNVFSPLLLLLIPFIGMYISKENKWSLFDFFTMGILLLTLSFGIKQVMKTTKNVKYRILILGIILIIFFLVWAELAVGIFGTPFGGN